MNKAQRKSLRRLMRRFGRPDSVFKAMSLDCYMVQFGSLWVGIEVDGYTHS